MYRSAGPQGAGPDGGPGAGADASTDGAAGKTKENVVDAEFVDVEDKK
jgi:hypothetical protein